MPHVRICGGPGEVTPLVYPTVRHNPLLNNPATIL